MSERGDCIAEKKEFDVWVAVRMIASDGGDLAMCLPAGASKKDDTLGTLYLIGNC